MKRKLQTKILSIFRTNFSWSRKTKLGICLSFPLRGYLNVSHLREDRFSLEKVFCMKDGCPPGITHTCHGRRYWWRHREIKVLFSCSVQWANDTKDHHGRRWHQEWIPEKTVGNPHGGWKSGEQGLGSDWFWWRIAGTRLSNNWLPFTNPTVLSLKPLFCILYNMILLSQTFLTELLLSPSRQ